VSQACWHRGLNNLANLYRHTQRLTEAERAYTEALGIYRELAKANAAAHLPDVAMTLNNLANLYSNTQRHTQAESAFQEALGIYRELAKANPAAYLPQIAKVSATVAFFYARRKDLIQARRFGEEAVNSYRELWQLSPQAYSDDLSRILVFLAVTVSGTEGERGTVCTLAQEAQRVASSTALQAVPHQLVVSFCH
jgi:tetratricopeptide (TPR) repeat protein